MLDGVPVCLFLWSKLAQAFLRKVIQVGGEKSERLTWNSGFSLLSRLGSPFFRLCKLICFFGVNWPKHS